MQQACHMMVTVCPAYLGTKVGSTAASAAAAAAAVGLLLFSRMLRALGTGGGAGLGNSLLLQLLLLLLLLLHLAPAFPTERFMSAAGKQASTLLMHTLPGRHHHC